MADRISKLRIEGFRGATQPFELSLDETKPVILIFGENGSGKSTIVDALECVGTGNHSFTEQWKISTAKAKYIPAFGREMADVNVTMEIGANTFTASLDKTGISVQNADKLPPVKVLRRKTLQAFIEAIPSKRYEEVARFLDIPNIESAESSLRAAEKAAEQAFNNAAAAAAQAQEHLFGLWQAEGSPGDEGAPKTAEVWARKQAEADPAALAARKASLSQQVSTVEKLSSATSQLQQASALLAAANARRQSAQSALTELEAEEKEDGSSALVTLLKDTKHFLEATPAANTCPVCEVTQINSSELKTRLDVRLAAMAALDQAGSALIDANRAASSAQNQFDQAQNSLVEAASLRLQQLGIQIEEEPGAAQKQAAALAINEAAALPTLQADLDAVSKQLSQLNAIRHSVSTLDGKSAEATLKQTLAKRLSRAVEVFESRRKTYVNAVLLDIANSVEALYQQIHPGESIGGLSFKLDDKKRASLLYGAAFLGQDDVQPQPYYSESHLDTMGLCIFMALAQRIGKDCIVVLDDVLGSVDNQHIGRTLDMLLGASDSLAQLIVTTHMRSMRNRLTAARTGSSNVQILDLNIWSPESGITHSIPQLDLDALKNLLTQTPFPREQVAISAGRQLENAFDYMTLKYGSRLPRMAVPLYTLSPLLDGVKQIKKWKTEYQSTVSELTPLLDALRPLIPVRNEAGAHYNADGDELSDVDIKHFGERSVELLEALRCADCLGMPQRQDNVAGNWRCQCGKTRMLPYKI